jgi:hypothetical protein
MDSLRNWFSSTIHGHPFPLAGLIIGSIFLLCWIFLEIRWKKCDKPHDWADWVPWISSIAIIASSYLFGLFSDKCKKELLVLWLSVDMHNLQ